VFSSFLTNTVLEAKGWVTSLRLKTLLLKFLQGVHYLKNEDVTEKNFDEVII